VAMLMGSQPAIAEGLDSVNPAADLIILRPFGLAMLAGGTVLMAPVGLWTLLVRPTEMDVPFDALMKTPFEYTFVDPLGSH
jgi:hypothetical protein